VSQAHWDIGYASQARRDLRRLDPQVRVRVVVAIERLAANDPRSDVRGLANSDEQRLRVGEWRVRFQRDAAAHQIVVLRVLPRGRAYDR
jgi:mRNA interferase RelE/StbE